MVSDCLNDPSTPFRVPQFGVVSDYVVKDGNLLIADNYKPGNLEIATHDDVVGDYAERKGANTS